MNERKDILERVKHLMKENSEIKVNCSKLARQLNCDRRTVSRYIDITRSGKEKRDILEKAFYGPITPEIPASILQLHPDITVIYSEK